jgi:hypothetical protein
LKQEAISGMKDPMLEEKERKRAGAAFKKLFPFLPKTERPLSWPSQGGRGK